MLPRPMARWPMHKFKEMPVQMDGVGHHSVVDQRHANPFALFKAVGLSRLAKLFAIEAPDETFHISGQVDV